MVARLIRRDALEPSYKRDGCFVATLCEDCLLTDCISNLSPSDERRLLALDDLTVSEALYVKALKERRLLVQAMHARGAKLRYIADRLRIDKHAVERDLR